MRETLLQVVDRWMCCNEGRMPSAAENERRKCARELERIARAIAIAPSSPCPMGLTPSLTDSKSCRESPPSWPPGWTSTFRRPPLVSFT